MSLSAFDYATAEAVGIVQQVDVPGRALTLLTRDAVREFDVAADCAVLLHGERVKLRLLQPKDYAHVVYSRTRGRRVAHCVEVGWRSPSFPGALSVPAGRDTAPARSAARPAPG